MVAVLLVIATPTIQGQIPDCHTLTGARNKVRGRSASASFGPAPQSAHAPLDNGQRLT